MTATVSIMADNAFTLDRLRRLASERLHADAPPRAGRSPSDYDLNPGMQVAAAGDGAKPAAVLVPIVARAEMTVLLTQRTDGLSSHAGQIAFPGGRIDPADESPLSAALREAQEEIGLDPGFVTPLGFLDTYRTGTGFAVMPLIGIVAPGFTVAANPAEVADVFEVPLAFLMDPRNHAQHSRVWKGAERTFYAMPYGERYIWGATAGILKNMHERLYAP